MFDLATLVIGLALATGIALYAGHRGWM